MKLNQIIFSVLIAGLLLSPLPLLANFCACCAERGQYSISVRKPADYELSELKLLKIADAALYTDAAYPDNIKGLSPLSETYTASILWPKKWFRFDFKNEQNGTGLLDLAPAATMVDFRADTYNEGEPVLYKELRFKARVLSGSGFFSKGIAPATEYFLVLQGKGNNCLSADQFTHWRLEITGKRASYAFYGRLKTS
jgi:hypothetical protein